MLFQRMILCAVALGLVAGILLAVGERFTTMRSIRVAEQYEQPAADTRAAIHGPFVDATAGVDRMLWLVLGLACVWAMRRWRERAQIALYGRGALARA